MMNMSRRKRGILLAMFIAFLGVLIADFVYSARFRVAIAGGAKGVLCETFRLTDNVLNGFSQTNHTFIGIENVAATVENVTEIVQVGSPTMDAILATIDATKDIQFAVADFLANLNNMNNVLGENQSAGKYTCVFCRTCCSGGSDSQVSVALTAIGSSVAQALVAVRAQVRDSLTGDGLAGIRESLESSLVTVESAKDDFEAQIKSSLFDNEPILEQVIGYINVATLVAMLLVVIPVLLLMGVLVWGTVGKLPIPPTACKPRNPCFASFSCCFTFFFALILFLLGGIFGLVAYLEASACEVVSDMDSLILRASELAELDAQVTTIMQTCLSPSGSGDVLSVVNVGSDGKTARDMLDISSAIDELFAQITAGLDGEGDVFSTNPAIVDLLDSIRDFGSLYVIDSALVSDMMAADISVFLATFQPEDVLEHLFQVALSGVPDCSDRVGIPLTGPAGELLRVSLVASGFPLNPGDITVTLPGIASFYSSLQAASVDVGTSGNVCPYDYSSLFVAGDSEPFNFFMQDKIDVVTSTFRCDTVSVSEDPDTAEAIVVTTEVFCTWTEWIAYVDALHGLLLTKAQTVDAVQASVIDAIQVDLRQIVQTEVLPLIQNLANGLDCKFIQVRWNGIYESLCWKETPGLVGSVICWLIFGWLCLIAIVMEFVVWRHLKDNWCLWMDMRVDVGEGGAHTGAHAGAHPVHPQSPSGGTATTIQISPDGHVMVVAAQPH